MNNDCIKDYYFLTYKRRILVFILFLQTGEKDVDKSPSRIGQVM